MLIDFTSPELSQRSPLLSDTAVADGGEIPLASPNFSGAQPSDGGTRGKFRMQSQTPPPAFDVAVADGGEILLVGPDCAGTRPLRDGTFGEFPRQLPTAPASDTAVGDDGEILLVGPNCTGIRQFLDGGKFGEIGIRTATNPFLADILASSGGRDAAVSNEVVNTRLSHDQPTANHVPLTLSPDTGTGIALKRSPYTGRVLPSLIGQTDSSPTARWSPGSAEVSIPLSSFRPEEVASDVALSHSQVMSVPAASPVLCETNLDESMSSTSPVGFVVSGKHRRMVGVGVCCMD